MGPRSFLFGERPPALVAQPPYDSRSSPTSMPDSSQWPDPCWESLASRRIRAPVAPTPGARQIHPASSDVSISPDAVPDTPSSAQVPFSQRRQSQPSSDLHGTDNGPSPLQTSTAPTTAPAASQASGTDSLLLGSLLPKDPDSSSRHRRTRLPSLDSLLPTPRIVSLISSMPPSLPRLWTAPTPPSTLEAPDSNFPDGCPSRQSSLLPTAAAASLLSGSRLKLPISRMLRGWVH